MVSAPLSSKSFTVSTRPRKAAACSAVSPSLLLALTSAPCSRSNATISVCPIRAAVANNVPPDFGSFMLTSIPFAIVCFTTLRLPADAASHTFSTGRALFPSDKFDDFTLSISAILALPASTCFCSNFMPNGFDRNCVISQGTANMSIGVAPSSFLAVTSAPFFMSSSALPACPKNIARCRAVLPSLFLPLTFAPCWRSSSAASVCPIVTAQVKGGISKCNALTSAPSAMCCLMALTSPSRAAPTKVFSVNCINPFAKSPSSGIANGGSGRLRHTGIPSAISVCISSLRLRMK